MWYCRVKVSHAPQSGVKAVLVKERPVSAKPSEEPQQFIEVRERGRGGEGEVIGS